MQVGIPWTRISPLTIKHTIHIDWEGPFSIKSVAALREPSDYGVYQIYGAHPTYGTVQLLYIGLASDRTFGVRVLEHGWMHGTRDISQIAIYVGRLSGGSTPDNDTWTTEISVAERILIYAHYPTYNKKKDLGSLEPDLRDVHVLNWKQHRDLLPEVSGARWSCLYDEISGYHAYSNRELKKPN